MRDFNAKTIRTLSQKGITIMGTTLLPDENGSFANGPRGYQVNDNGTAKVWTWHGVIDAAKA
jgi:hypothetical protein